MKIDRCQHPDCNGLMGVSGDFEGGECLVCGRHPPVPHQEPTREPHGHAFMRDGKRTREGIGKASPIFPQVIR